MEQVCIFGQKWLDKLNIEGGISSNLDDEDVFYDEILEEAFFVDRQEAENSEQYKQIIPYIIIRKEDKIFSYQRTKSGGEARLHNKLSIGIGGHVNPSDALDDIIQEPIDMISMCAARELLEELRFTSNVDGADFKVKHRGFIYDDSNEVGRVHFGVCLEIWLPNTLSFTSITTNDPAISTIAWLTIDELKQKDNLENWSQLALKIIDSVNKGDDE